MWAEIWMSLDMAHYYNIHTKKLERTRGAGAPEVLRRDRLRKNFAFGEISLKIWRLRRQKIVIVKQIFFAQLFQKSRFFLGPGKRFLFRQVLVIFGTLFGTPLLHCLLDGMKPGPRIFEDLDVFRGHTSYRHQTDAHKLFRNRGCWLESALILRAQKCCWRILLSSVPK